MHFLELYNRKLNNYNTVKKGQNKMLKQNNSVRLDGQKAKDTDKLLKEYQDLIIQYKDIEARKKEVLAEIIKLSKVGVNETNKFVFKISEIAGKETISVNKLKENEPSIYTVLRQKNLVSMGDNYLKITSIKPKTKI